MKLKRFFSSTFFLKGIFIISLAVLVFISAVYYKHSIAVTDCSESLIHSYKVQVELEQLMSYLKDAEAGQRGYIISEDTSFLRPFYGSRLKIDQSFSRLKILAVHNLKQRNNLDSLYSLINIRYKYFVISLMLHEEKKGDAHLEYEFMLKGRDVMDKIRLHMNDMINLEKIYLKETQQKYDDEISFTPIFTLLLFLFTLMIFVFSYLNINKNLIVLKEANAKLLITTEAINHAEEIGGFSSWQWDLETNKLSYSDSQYHLLGVEPQSFEPNIENFLVFVHPEDRHIIADSTKVVMTNDQYPSAFFRIIRKDGTLRYIKSISKLLVDENGKKTLIGINSDITESHLGKLVLEEKNRELERNNRELASFNHIASHDLQEPLRKIQTFISRIAENELKSMSPKGQDYFERIEMAANRMRILIDDLLRFSRTNKTEKPFEKTDLNLLLESAKQDLGQAIEESNATIQVTSLPVLNVIPFQIQQLFLNIIGNSIKYRKKNIAPMIKIACKKVSAKDEPLLKQASSEKYYRITIADNGLGFDQQYAENIFILFQRLYNASEYPGTGIGLSICKKIIENHNGYIFANGELGEGAIFTFFLPA